MFVNDHGDGLSFMWTFILREKTIKEILKTLGITV